MQNQSIIRSIKVPDKVPSGKDHKSEPIRRSLLSADDRGRSRFKWGGDDGNHKWLPMFFHLFLDLQYS